MVLLLFGRPLSCRGAARRRRRRLAHRPGQELLDTLRARWRAACWQPRAVQGQPAINQPSGKVARNQHRKREPRREPVKRTEEEIVALRAGRAATRALTGAPPHDPNAGVRR